MPIMDGAEWLKGYTFGQVDEHCAVELRSEEEQRYWIFPLPEDKAEEVATSLNNESKFGLEAVSSYDHDNEIWYVEVEFNE